MGPKQPERSRKHGQSITRLLFFSLLKNYCTHLKKRGGGSQGQMLFGIQTGSPLIRDQAIEHREIVSQPPVYGKITTVCDCHSPRIRKPSLILSGDTWPAISAVSSIGVTALRPDGGRIAIARAGVVYVFACDNAEVIEVRGGRPGGRAEGRVTTCI